eukprot:scpid106639/ scgid22535/ 
MIGYRHLQGSPQQLVVTATAIQPLFDNSRCGSSVNISNDGHTLSSTGGGYRSACTTPMVTDTGSSTLKVRIDNTLHGHIFLSACSSRNPNLTGTYQQDKAQCFGWYGCHSVMLMATSPEEPLVKSGKLATSFIAPLIMMVTLSLADMREGVPQKPSRTSQVHCTGLCHSATRVMKSL